jgi:D-aminopeptidase
MGSIAATGSGDLFLCFSTGHRTRPMTRGAMSQFSADVQILPTLLVDSLFEATIDATEEAIVNALVSATTMIGRDGRTAHALPHDRLRHIMAQHGRLNDG